MRAKMIRINVDLIQIPYKAQQAQVMDPRKTRRGPH